MIAVLQIILWSTECKTLKVSTTCSDVFQVFSQIRFGSPLDNCSWFASSSSSETAQGFRKLFCRTLQMLQTAYSVA